ncbi:ABC transporter permease [Streptomyces sp. NPDC058534]|uniref:ABC transporter permease n=1 Tax=Streptomyces sp. NPDC058534 TaxID=3346541 RepID=UPI00365E1A23
MNFVKRAGTSLRVRKSRTAALLGIFLVICTLLLGGFLLQGAAARQEAEVRRVIGVDVTVRGEGLTPDLADRLGSSEVVHRYNPLLPTVAAASGFSPLEAEPPGPGGTRAGNREERPLLALNGVRDSGLLLPFSYGSTRITAGRAITPQDAGRHVALVEERLAERNGLTVGDTVRMRSADGKRTTSATIVGVFRDPTPDPARWTPARELPGNTAYVPVSTVRQLGGGTADVTEAVYRIGSPEQAEHLYAEAERLLGAGAYEFRVNDKAYLDQARPVQRVGTFAELIVWLIALAGALILGLVVLVQTRERRAELGVLLSMGETKWKLVGQHVVEVTAVALPAVFIAAQIAVAAGPRTGDALLPGEADKPAARTGAPRTTVDPPATRVELSDVGGVAGIALGISLVATVLPGIGILRLHPRSILTDDA